MNNTIEQKVQQSGMTRKQAKRLELGIVAMSLISLVMIFQPFSITLFSLGAVMVFISGLAFNLIPVCVEGKPFSAVVKTAGIVVVVFCVVLMLSFGSAYMYGIYLTTQ